MNARSALLGQFFVFCVTVAVSVYFAITLPDTVPTHWGFNGQADQYGSKWLPVLLLPCLSLTMLALTIVLPFLSPKNFEVTRSGKAYGEIMLLVSALMGVLDVLILLKTASIPIDIARWIFAACFLFFALMGNLMGKIKRNFYMGIRTPWTLADERVWTQTHRLAAHQWFVGGLIGGILTLAGVPMPVMIGYLIVMAFVPVVLSFMIYKRLNP